MLEQITFKSGPKTISADLYSPTGTADSGLVVIAYGTDGLTDDLNGPWETMIRGYADALAKRGFFAMIPGYFTRTGTSPGDDALKSMLQNRPDWEAALIDSVTKGKTLARVDASRVGLLGFSLGGHLCLRIRAASKPKALVEFFAPVIDGLGSAGSVPNAQIHHGKADSVPGTDFSNALSIESTLKAEGTATELFPYPGAGHGFKGEDADNKNARALSQSRTLSFFETHL